MNQLQEEEDKDENGLKRGCALIQAVLLHTWAFVNWRAH